MNNNGNNYSGLDIRKVKTYFYGKSKAGPIWLLIASLYIALGTPPIIIISIGHDLRLIITNETIVGFIFFVIIALSFISAVILFILAIRKLKSKEGLVSDSEYDSMIISYLSNIQQRAADVLGIDMSEVNEAAPIVITNYKFDGANCLKWGKDYISRTNLYDYVIFFFSQNEVYSYSLVLDTLTAYYYENTNVYFYKDIVSISTTMQPAQVRKIRFNYEAFQLITTGGTALTVSLNNKESAMRSINAMRSLIKEKKNER